MPHYHVVFTLPAQIADIAYQNKAVIYNLLFEASSETLLTIAADPKHLGVRIGFLSVLHSWGSALTHHPHVHMIVPGGGISRDGSKWISCRPRYLLPAPVLSQLFRRLFLEKLVAARIRHYGLFANGSRADNIARARELLNVPTPQKQTSDAKAANPDQPPALAQPCPCCGGRMIIIETFEPGATPRYRPSAPTRACVAHFLSASLVCKA